MTWGFKEENESRVEREFIVICRPVCSGPSPWRSLRLIWNGCCGCGRIDEICACSSTSKSDRGTVVSFRIRTVGGAAVSRCGCKCAHTEDIRTHQCVCGCFYLLFLKHYHGYRKIVQNSLSLTGGGWKCLLQPLKRLLFSYIYSF